MKFSSIAMLAVAATPFVSMVSAQTPADLLAFIRAECTPATPAPTKGSSKGAKGDTRRQLQAKGDGKGSKSDDSEGSGSCTGVLLAKFPSGNGLEDEGTVIDACDLVDTVAGTTPIGTATELIGFPPGTGEIFLRAGTPFPSPVTVTFDFISAASGQANSAYIEGVVSRCGFDVPIDNFLPSNPDTILAPRNVASVEPFDSTRLIPLGSLTLTNGMGGITADSGNYDIIYGVFCYGLYDPSDINPVVAEYVQAIETNTCPEDEEEETGKKGGR